MTKTASKAMHVVEEWDSQYSMTHKLWFPCRIILTDELNFAITKIANGGIKRAQVSHPERNATVLKITITGTSGNSITKLRAIIYLILDSIGRGKGHVTLELKGRMEPFELDRTDPPIESPQERRKRERKERHRASMRESLQRRFQPLNS